MKRGYIQRLRCKELKMTYNDCKVIPSSAAALSGVKAYFEPKAPFLKVSLGGTSVPKTLSRRQGGHGGNFNRAGSWFCSLILAKSNHDLTVYLLLLSCVLIIAAYFSLALRPLDHSFVWESTVKKSRHKYSDASFKDIGSNKPLGTVQFRRRLVGVGAAILVSLHHMFKMPQESQEQLFHIISLGNSNIAWNCKQHSLTWTYSLIFIISLFMDTYIYNPCALSACQARLGVGAKVKDLTEYCTRDPDVEVQLRLPKSCVVTGVPYGRQPSNFREIKC